MWSPPARPTGHPSSSAMASLSSGIRGATNCGHSAVPGTAPSRPTCGATGGAAAPPRSTRYGADNLTADLCGLLDHFGYKQAAFVGHDWGAIVVWEMGRLHPTRMSSLFNMSVPYTNPPVPPIDIFEKIFAGKFFYILYFQPVGIAEAEFEADPRHFLRTMLYSASGEGMTGGHRALADAPADGTRFVDTLAPAPAELPAWLTEADVDVYAAAFDQSGFFGPVSYYRNMNANWERSHRIEPTIFTMPVGFLTGALDPVNTMMPGAADTMARVLPDFRSTTVVEGAGHWVQQEKPDETNAALLEFLTAAG